MAEPIASTPALPSLDDVYRAAERLEGQAHRTPVFTSRTLDERCGARVFLKCENYQRTGAFKFRGALNAVSKLPSTEQRRGVLTFSSGNHAGAMALVGRLLGVPTTVIMPKNAPLAKVEATRGYGAEVILYDPEETTREALATQMREERGLTLIPPYDHADVVAGQGTAALELFEQAGPLDALLVPCGGGGLLSGCSIVAKGAVSPCRVVGVEPETADDATRSFRSGTLHRVHNPPTVADGLRTPSLGAITFPLIQAHVDEFQTVTEAEIIASMHFLWTRMKLVVEPSGAVAPAPLINGTASSRWGERVGVILSGGNVDLDSACSLLARV
ncbi:MAG: threo-3-hydroxy-L-aspartate ammonia-lyase [Gemmatimonadetes bacterium]|nr:threo-3-hydroxy-L-aspartate ammonia-lyase [Gemmatimonadota bacterium]